MAVLATDGFEQAELTEPVKALKQAGATVHVVAPNDGEIQGWSTTARRTTCRSASTSTKPNPTVTTG